MTDNGTYHCHAWNKFDRDTASAVLIVRGMASAAAPALNV